MPIAIGIDSLKLRLALTTALVMGASVAATVVHAVHEAQHRAEQSILESNLGAGQIAASLSASVIERQRALSAAAMQWPAAGAPGGPRAQAFLAGQAVLRTLFDRLALAPAGALPAAPIRTPSISPPMPAAGGRGRHELLFTVPLPGAAANGAVLAGALSLDSSNFLTRAGQGESLGEAALQTLVADRQGRVLARSDTSPLLARIDADPRLRTTVARWRDEGSPLEPAPWTEHVDGNFVAMAAVPGTDWMVIRTASSQALFDRASRSILRITAIGLLAAFAGAVLIFAVTAWLLRPMRRLRQRALRALDPAQAPGAGWPRGRGEVGQLSAVLRHVSEQLAASRDAMAQSLGRMQAVLDHAPVGVAFTIDGRFALVSREFERLLGYGAGELEGSAWDRLLGTSAPATTDADRAAVHADDGGAPELQLRRRDGSPVWVWLQGAIVHGRDSAQHRIWIVGDATDTRRQREQLQWTATHDPLTDLANRREFEHQLRMLLADRRGHGPACVLFIDLDHFKQVNDRAGHAAGDALLRRIAQALQRRVRGEDTVARLGGDEFAVLLRGCRLEQAARIAEGIRLEIQGDAGMDGVSTGVTASVGLVEIDGSLSTLSSVLEAADSACYAAKHAGRNAVSTDRSDAAAAIERRAA